MSHFYFFGPGCGKVKTPAPIYVTSSNVNPIYILSLMHLHKRVGGEDVV